MTLIERKLMGHGGVYDELGQVATILGCRRGQQKLGARVDAVRDAVEDIAEQHRGAVDRASTMYAEFLAERRMLREWLAELGVTDEQMAARYATLSGGQ